MNKRFKSNQIKLNNDIKIDEIKKMIKECYSNELNWKKWIKNWIELIK